MAFKKGHKLSGSRKGVSNKLTASVKDVFTTVFADLQDHPTAKLQVWAKTNPTDFYKLCAKLIPAAIDVSQEGTIVIKVIRE